MRIAFDLDDTLISSYPNFETEKPTRHIFSKIFIHEKLRKGAKEIFDFLKNKGHQTWIYTSSFRNIFYIKRLFWLYNISLDGVINQNIHNKIVQEKSSKHPPTFGIDILIDDSLGVKEEGNIFGFKVVVLRYDDRMWLEKVKTEILNFT